MVVWILNPREIQTSVPLQHLLGELDTFSDLGESEVFKGSRVFFQRHITQFAPTSGQCNQDRAALILNQSVEVELQELRSQCRPC